ncbi:MAG: UDP-N-acetylmuramoyl-L-alanine--D-glutamate ligase [Gimesia sp.]
MPVIPFLIHEFELKGSHVTVLGLGRFGGGIAVVAYLASRGAQITVIDAKSADALADSLKQLDSYPDIQYMLGATFSQLPATDLLVANPAIPPEHELLKSAREQQIPVTSEIELFWQLNPGKVIGITGSNGKSTTTAMIHAIIAASGVPCWLGGNIGISLLPMIEQIQPDDWVILELSSFQLESLNRIQVSPHIGVVTNFSPNHLDWHQTVEHYRQSKQTIFRWQTEHDFAIINADEPKLQGWSSRGTVCLFGANSLLQPDVLVNDDGFLITKQTKRFRPQLNVPGTHNRMNAAAAIAACGCAGIDETAMQKGLEAFSGLPHRLQYIGEYQNRRFYNDSLATTPESAICAIVTFTDSPVILLAGGSDKKVDLHDFAMTFFEHTKATALIGETGPILCEIIRHSKSQIREGSHALISHPHQSFQEAFHWAFQQSDPGDVILLSPGCASFGWFSSFEERGDYFTELFQRLSGDTNDSAQK